MKKCPKCGGDYPDTTTLCPADGSALETTGDSLIGQILAGKYRIEEALKDGGMGKVYRGTHILMDKTVAIKVLRASLAADEKIVARFSREARAASRLSHPHALSVTDFGEDEDGRVFLVMEYLNGKTLKEIIRNEGPLPLARVAEIVRQVGGALQAAHDEGVIHRDLKSDNIMLLSTNAGDYAKVLDFGIAKIIEPEGGFDLELTAPNLVIGTPQYMSPEQCSQLGTIDSRSDIYSLGVIIYEMLVGHVPFGGESSTTVMLKQMQEPAPSVLQERTDLPAAVGRVVARALAKLPEERYQRADELVEDLTIAATMGTGTAEVKLVGSDTGGQREATLDNAVQLPDEETIVRPRLARPVERAPITVRTDAPPVNRSSSFNPWKVLIPSAAALLVIFTVIYAFTRNSQSPKTHQGTSLVADPNGQPVEPVQPATGKSEEGIPAGGAIANPVVNSNANASPSVRAESSATPTVSANENANINENTNANANDNSNRKAPPVASPSRPVNVNEPPPPPPSPAATKAPTPKTNPTLPNPVAASTPQ
jgi:serine/threonine-protein kinase